MLTNLYFWLNLDFLLNQFNFYFIVILIIGTFLIIIIIFIDPLHYAE